MARVPERKYDVADWWPFREFPGQFRQSFVGRSAAASRSLSLYPNPCPCRFRPDTAFDDEVNKINFSDKYYCSLKSWERRKFGRTMPSPLLTITLMYVCVTKLGVPWGTMPQTLTKSGPQPNTEIVQSRQKYSNCASAPLGFFGRGKVRGSPSNAQYSRDRGQLAVCEMWTSYDSSLGHCSCVSLSQTDTCK